MLNGEKKTCLLPEIFLPEGIQDVATTLAVQMLTFIGAEICATLRSANVTEAVTAERR